MTPSRSPRRNHHPKLAAVYRAVITRISLITEDRVTRYEGPFMSRGAARAAITRAKPRYHERGLYRIEGVVEYSPLRWTRVADGNLPEVEA